MSLLAAPDDMIDDMIDDMLDDMIDGTIDYMIDDLFDHTPHTTQHTPHSAHHTQQPLPQSVAILAQGAEHVAFEQLQAWPVGISIRRPARSRQGIMNGGLGEGMGPDHLAQVQAAACWGVHLGG